MLMPGLTDRYDEIGSIQYTVLSPAPVQPTSPCQFTCHQRMPLAQTGPASTVKPPPAGIVLRTPLLLRAVLGDLLRRFGSPGSTRPRCPMFIRAGSDGQSTSAVDGVIVSPANMSVNT